MVAMRIRADQFDLTIKAARNPVVIDLVALGAALDVVPTVLIVQIAVLHAEDGARMRELVRRHVDGMLSRPASTVIDLDVFERERTGVCISAEDAVRGAVVDDRVTDGDVMSMMIDATEGASGDIKALEDVVIRQSELDGIGSA